MNAAVDYIEQNLAGEIDFTKAAEKAACSAFHFQRVFFAINEITPADYARRRKLTLAATELTYGNAKVIDVAMKYGYDSPNAFTRAFRQLHSVNPQAARAPGVRLTAFPRIYFHIKLEGGKDVDYKLIEKPAFDIMGKSRKIHLDKGQHTKEISTFWDEYGPTAECQKLFKLGGKQG
jgi:AraC family transcriptional regulator